MDKDKESGPLAFLDRLLDDERDSNLHFGDVRFWKHLEHVNTKQIYRTKSLEYRTLKMMFCEAVFYVFFLVTLTNFMIQLRTGSIYESRRQQLDYWAGCKRIQGQRSCKMHDVTDGASLMTWLKEDFAPRAFVNQDSYTGITDSPSVFRLQSGVVGWLPRYVDDTKTSVLVGSIRIRQLRVQYNVNCKIKDEFISIHPDCFAAYTKGAESKLKWHPEWAPAQVQPHYKWQFPNATDQTNTVGYHGVYPGSGFVLDLPLDLTGAIRRLRELEEWKWIDIRTRAVIIELNTVNPNVNTFVNSKILFEFPAIGGVVTKQDVVAFRAIQTSLALALTDDVMMFGQLLMVTAFFLMLFLYVFFLIFKNGGRYFTYFWSSVDLLILFFFVILLFTYLNIWTIAAEEPNLHPEVFGDPEMFFPIGRIISPIEFSNSIMAVLGLLCWLRVIKYFTLSTFFMGFVRVIERCIVNLILFAGLLMLVLFGFAVALHIGFGAVDNVFGTLWGSLVAVIVTPAGGVDLEPIFASGDLLGPVLIILYIIAVLLLLLNTFMAICVDTYSVCTFQITEATKAKKNSATKIFLWTYFNAMKGIRLVGKETEDDQGGPDEQDISLTSLPEAVQRQYLEEKERMERILHNAESSQRQEKERRALMLAGDDPAPEVSLKAWRPPSLQDEDIQNMQVKRVQLQRMLEDHPIFVDVCGTEKAVELVRRFKVDISGVDPYEAVAQLQASVARKLKDLQDRGMDLDFDEMEALKMVSQELHSALTESQKEWRAELLSVMQMAQLLSRELINLTGRIAQVQQNHTDLSVKVSPA